MMGNKPLEGVTILVVEDDDGHAELIRLHLVESGLENPVLRFKDGQAILDFLYQRGSGLKRNEENTYVVLLDIRLPKVDGTEVLRQIKNDKTLKTIPVIILTTTDDTQEIEKCYALGCNSYVTKPVEFGAFSEAINRLGNFLMIAQFPALGKEEMQDE
jgi:CheY-like chemotaxis protein